MENWNHAKEIFYSALHKLPAEREVFLAEVCGDDSQLLSDVKMLLDSYKSEFLEQPILDFHTDSLPEIPNNSQFQTGDIINHYIILRMLGRGGMGEVYLARDKKLDRLVAIKILHQGAGEKAEKRLLREARSVAKLEHPNICSVYEVGETEQFPFIVMQFVEGETLDKLIKSNSISAFESIEFTKQIAEALNEAHSHNIIHRDIKPSNIIIDSKNQVKVLDFSLAKKVLVETGADTESMLSELGVVAGTVAYMSPEQARGQELDARSDIWSLGVVFYEMLTGNLPFIGQTKADTISAILIGKYPSLKEIVTNPPLNADELIENSLQVETNNRFQNISNFIEHLLTVKSETEKITLINPPDEYQFQNTADNFVNQSSQTNIITSQLTKPFYLNKAILFLDRFFNFYRFPSISLIGLSLIGLIGLITIVFFPKSANTKKNIFLDRLSVVKFFNQNNKPPGVFFDVSFSPDSNFVVFTVSRSGKDKIYTKLLGSNDLVTLTEGDNNEHSPIWSPDGLRVAFVSKKDNRFGIWTISYLGGTPVFLTPLPPTEDEYLLTKWSNDGKSIYFQLSGKLNKIEITSAQISEVVQPKNEVFELIELSPDEQKVAYMTIVNGKEQIIVESIQNVELAKLSDENFRFTLPFWHPYSEKLAYSSNQTGIFQLYYFDLKENTENQLTFSHFDSTLPIFSTDGLTLTYKYNTNF